MKHYKVTIKEAGVGAWIFRGYAYVAAANANEAMQVIGDEQRSSQPMVKFGLHAEEITEVEYKQHAIIQEDLPF